MTRFVEVDLLEESGEFDYSVAESMRSSFSSAASRIEGQAGARLTGVSRAGEDFRGRFSEIFASNASTAASDAGELASALRKVAGYVTTMVDAAREEDRRRRESNEWVRHHNQRTIWEKGWDFFAGEDPRPAHHKAAAPSFAPADSSTQTRQNPAPGSGGSGGGTSSARPEDLRSFAAGSRELDGELTGLPGSLEGELSSFASACPWGTITASGVVRALGEYLDANEQDAIWAGVVADAFAAAGGNGRVSRLSDAALEQAVAAAGVSGPRTSLQIDPPQAAGAVPTSGYANDPVNTATGNFIEPETDLSFTGVASTLSFSRMYNSLPSALEAPGVFGPGWASVLDQRLVLSDAGCRWVTDDGRAVDFPREGAGYGRAVGENFWLAAEPAAGASLAELASLGAVPDGTLEVLVVRNNQGAWWAFTRDGAWIGTGAGPGRTVAAHREAPVEGAEHGVVARLAHVRGRALEVDYADGRVAVLRASDGRRVEYAYDAAGCLTGVSTGQGKRSYRWNEAGLIDAVYSAAGVCEAENTYDEAGRVTGQITQHGRRVRFAYLPGRVTAVSDEDGSRSNAWIADAKGRLVGVLDSDDQRQSMAYDGHGNLVSFTERDGSVTVHAYDERGRRVRTVTPEGADLTYGWDDQDRVTTLVTESGAVVSYEYADETGRDPSVIIDPLGGRTELTWRAGLLARVVDPVGVAVEFDYDAFGDLVATRNAAGDVARIVRDQAGRPLEALSPSGARTLFEYDEAGVLVRRQDADGGIWAFEHDHTGRITASVAPDGGRTELEYGPDGELVKTVDPLGRVIERTFDELGNVTGAVLPDGARWGFVHDDLSRLIGITDPAGHDWTREYDTVGALSAVVDPTGVRTQASTDRKTGTATLSEVFTSTTMRFDEYGRPTRIEGADGAAELVSYDAAGNPVELVDGEGGLTVLGRDAAGKIVSVTAPTGAVTRFEYDGCGRPWRSIDPSGAVTELAYDADQRVCARTLPTGEVESFEYDPCGRLLLHRVPGRGVSRYAYDRAGRMTFVQDAWHGIRRFKYNVAGELVESVNGVGGRTRFEYDVRGRLVRVTDPVGGVTTRTYTETDQVASVTDPLGRVSTATYDPAGRMLSQTDPDGRTTSWSYDAAGGEASVSVDGQLTAAVERDVLRRKVSVTDYTGPEGLAVEHELVFDRRGLLVSRTRGSEGLSWEYDADGQRRRFVDAHGTVTDYTRDAAGRVVGVQNSLLGAASFVHDASGRITRATVGDLVQEWVYRDGWLAEHSRTDLGGAGAPEVSLIGRDSEGRVSGITRAGLVTRYGYDGAGQMVSAATTRDGHSAETSGWEYDAGGRMVREDTPAGVREFEYDDAGQLLAVTGPEGVRVEFVYDGLGRRSRLIGADGSWTEYAWGAGGSLAGTTTKTADGQVVSGHRLWVDALGELARVDGAEVWWDSACPVPVLAGIGGGQVLSLPGGVTGAGDAWLTSGWRVARATDEVDPWAVIGAPTLPGVTSEVAGSEGLSGVLPAGVGLTGGGGLHVGGLEWLGARAYDPAVRGFLSTDPLAPVLGAGWDGNPYSYAGNNPLNATDPTGLRPLTDDELQSYDQSSGGAFAAVADWTKDNWEYLAGGAMVIAGGVLMATGVGGPAGMMLIGAGADTIIQKATTGEVNWGQVALSGALGGFAGAGIAARAGFTGMKGALVAGSSSGGISGGIQGGYGYYSGPGPHSVTGALSATAQGTVFGAAMGGAGGAIGRGAVHAVNRFRLRGHYGPINPGPLEPDVAATFRSGSYHRVRTSAPVDLYRVYGGRAGALSHFWTRDMPSGPLQSQLDSALNPAWGNTATEISHIRVPARTRFYEGVAAPQPLGGLPDSPWDEAYGSISGGGNQVYIDGMVSKEWVVR